MARGPKPKDPEVRQRRNKASTAAELPAPEVAVRQARATKVPPLNASMLGLKRGQGGVRPQVHRWWLKAWRSPMAPRWIETDVEVLYLCAQLHQQLQMFLEEGKSITALAAEIRQQEARIGLDVMARRRLDWRIEANRPADKPAPAAATPPEEDEEDPRRHLRAVK